MRKQYLRRKSHPHSRGKKKRGTGLWREQHDIRPLHQREDLVGALVREELGAGMESLGDLSRPVRHRPGVKEIWAPC